VVTGVSNVLRGCRYIAVAGARGTGLEHYMTSMARSVLPLSYLYTAGMHFTSKVYVLPD
jgi:hypothetical protein